MSRNIKFVFIYLISLSNAYTYYIFIYISTRSIEIYMFLSKIDVKYSDNCAGSMIQHWEVVIDVPLLICMVFIHDSNVQKSNTIENIYDSPLSLMDHSQYAVQIGMQCTALDEWVVY
jgi:hypothetical protein